MWNQKLIQNWTSHLPHAIHFQTEDIYSTSQLCSVHCSRWPQFLWKIFITVLFGKPAWGAENESQGHSFSYLGFFQIEVCVLHDQGRSGGQRCDTCTRAFRASGKTSWRLSKWNLQTSVVFTTWKAYALPLFLSLPALVCPVTAVGWPCPWQPGGVDAAGGPW